MVGMRLETIVEEETVAAFSRAALERQRDEIAKAAGRHGVLAREEPVVGLEPDIRVALHRLGDQMGAEAARDGGGHRLGEEDPDMPAIARTRSFEGRRHPLRPAGFKESVRIPPPGLLVEVGGEKPTGIVGKHGIDADRVASAQMSVDRLVRHRRECLIGTGAALDPGLLADAGRPLVGARRRIARLARPGVFPALWIDILAAAKQGPEQRDLFARRRTVGDRSVARWHVFQICPQRLKFGKPYLKGRLFGPEAHKPLAYERGLPAVGCCLRQTFPDACRRPMSPCKPASKQDIATGDLG